MCLYIALTVETNTHGKNSLMLAKRKALHECMPITDGSAPASSNCLVTSHLNVCEDKYTAVLPSVFYGEKTNEHPRTTIFEVNIWIISQ